MSEPANAGARGSERSREHATPLPASVSPGPASVSPAPERVAPWPERGASWPERIAPWIEGAGLALLVFAVLALGGEAVRASYHGYLHATIGEAVLREGLTPENPYHAGAPLRYYTLYPALGALLGRLGCGPMWAFAWLNVLAALLLAPALDALGRACGSSFGARRAAFVAALLGFNALGWIGFLVAPEVRWGAPPVYALQPSCFAGQAFGWDARLQAFLPKFLNVSSFALALPFAAWAMAGALGAARASLARSLDDRSALAEHALAASNERSTTFGALASGLALGVALALNPLAGGLAGGCMAAWLAPRVRDAGVFRRWLLAGIVALAVALPFLLPAFTRGPIGPSLTGKPDLGGTPLANLLGPIALVLPLALIGMRTFEARVRWRLALAIGACAVLVLVGEMPQGNEYKMERLAALLLALPAGAWAARLWTRGLRTRVVVAILAFAALPMLVLAASAYLAWGRSTSPPPLVARDGRLSAPSLSDVDAFAEHSARADAVVVMAHGEEGSRLSASLVQGNALAPALSHALFVDLPQIHNEHQPDLERRLELVARLFDGRGGERHAILAEIRSVLPERPLLFLVPATQPDLASVLERAGVLRIGNSAWFLAPPLASANSEER